MIKGARSRYLRQFLGISALIKTQESQEGNMDRQNWSGLKWIAFG